MLTTILDLRAGVEAAVMPSFTRVLTLTLAAELSVRFLLSQKKMQLTAKQVKLCIFKIAYLDLEDRRPWARS